MKKYNASAPVKPVRAKPVGVVRRAPRSADRASSLLDESSFSVAASRSGKLSTGVKIRRKKR